MVTRTHLNQTATVRYPVKGCLNRNPTTRTVMFEYRERIINESARIRHVDILKNDCVKCNLPWIGIGAHSQSIPKISSQQEIAWLSLNILSTFVVCF